MRRASAANYRADVDSMTTLQNAIATCREIAVGDRIGAVEEEVRRQRWIASRQRAIQTVHAQAPRFVLESALVVAAVGLTSAVFLTRDAEVAVATLSLFLAATARILPSLMRLNSARLQLRGVSGEAAAVLQLVAELTPPHDQPIDLTDPVDREGLDLAISGLHYSYPGREEPAVTGVSLELPAGRSLAIVGATGAGKSTLADLILGLLEPDSGTVAVGGRRPAEVIRHQPGSVAYVPQDVQLIAGTVRDNVALAVPTDEVADERVWEALRRAHLADFVAGLAGLDTVVGERGVRMSGGQRQRLGLARALYSRPRLLVLDEATSALDAETEAAVTTTLHDLSGQVTTVTIAHRLATVRSADVLVYLAEGRMVAAGTFDEVRSRVPDFDRQAELLGL